MANTAREVRFEELLPLARRTAAHYARKVPSHLRDDIEQAGAEGLWGALLHVDPKRKASLYGYAARRVRGSVLDELRRQDPLTRDQRRQFRQARKVEHEQTASLGRAPTEEEIARCLGITSQAYVSQQATFLASRSVDTKDKPEDRTQAVSVEPEETDPETQTEKSEQRQVLASVFATLPERLRTLLGLYYVEERTLKEIGKAMGITESRVCQLHSQAIELLRERFPAAA